MAFLEGIPVCPFMETCNNQDMNMIIFDRLESLAFGCLFFGKKRFFLTRNDIII